MQVNADEGFAVCQGRILDMHASIQDCGLRADATICIQGRLCGGKPVKVIASNLLCIADKRGLR